MSLKPATALGVGSTFALSVLAAPFTHHDGNHHLPPGDAPLALIFAASTASVSAPSTGIIAWPINAIHDADYTALDTTPLKSDGQVEKGA